MDSAMLTELLYGFCTLSALLLLGTLLRAKIPIFRRLFLPASVIGGFIGLLAGPILWGTYAPVPFPESWLTTWAALPGVLIVPVVASVPLGMKARAKTGGGGSGRKTSSNVLKMFAILGGIQAIQAAIGMLTQGVFNRFFGYDLYPTFGLELNCGFSGGHGTAGIVGSYLDGLHLPYWNLAQGVTTTTATVGLIGGMIIGIFAINVAARTGKTALLKKPSEIPAELAKGYQMNPAAQKSTGSETTLSSSIESLTFHLALILATCGLAYIVMGLVVSTGLPLINTIPIWAYAILTMFAVNAVLQKIGLGNLIDSKTKSRISGAFSDFAIVAAIASLPVKAIAQYIVPIAVMCAVGLVLTYAILRWLCTKFFTDFTFERTMACLGTSTGVFITGLMLLKICDPDYESPVLNDYSVGFSLTSVVTFILLAVVVNLMLTYNIFLNALIMLAIFLVYVVLMLFADKLSGAKQAN